MSLNRTTIIKNKKTMKMLDSTTEVIYNVKVCHGLYAAINNNYYRKYKITYIIHYIDFLEEKVHSNWFIVRIHKW